MTCAGKKKKEKKYIIIASPSPPLLLHPPYMSGVSLALPRTPFLFVLEYGFRSPCLGHEYNGSRRRSALESTREPAGTLCFTWL